MISLSKKLTPIADKFLINLKSRWFAEHHPVVDYNKFLPIADEWFKSTERNQLDGWDTFKYKDVIMGCTHYIESFIIQHGWDNFQILEDEYGYYGMMGKFGVPIDQLQENKPLIVSLPNWKYADLRPNLDYLFKICEQKNIDIHIDFAWITTAKDINLDLSHPCVKSFAMSMSKYNLHWNRIGLRWCKQRTVDSITIMNHYYGDVNSALTSCGAFMMKNIPRDYAWDTYESHYNRLCNENNLIQTKMIHVVKKQNDDTPYSIGPVLSNL